jgi:hypothetical protein
MLANTEHLKGLVIRATDGEIGTVDQLYFDDESWAIRYLTVKTGSWLEDREVLISPFSVTNVDWPAKRLDVALTKKQVKDSPSIDTQRPVSRQYETEYLGYYGYPNYWNGSYLWGEGASPAMTTRIDSPKEVLAERIQRASMDSHLRSTGAIAGYHIEAMDGEIGHVAGFYMDDETWAIRYIEVATRNWWPGKKVLFSPAWIQKASWVNSKVESVFTGMRSRPHLFSSIPYHSLVNMKTSSTVTMAGPHIGCMTTNPSLFCLSAPLK